MSYMLGLSFKYHRYRQDAIVEIYADERLVDEFRLSENINYKTIIYEADDCPFDPKSLYNYNPNDSEDYNAVLIIPEKLFLFEIDEAYLERSIRVEVKNSNSNYTNGFITEYSYMQFCQIFLLPTCFLEKNNWINMKRFDQWRLARVDSFFPFLNGKSITLNSNSGVSNMSHRSLYNRVLGGNFSLEIFLHKKYNLIHLGKPLIGKKQIHWYTARILWAFKTLNT